MAETITFTISGSDGSTDDVTVPETLISLLAEEDEPAAAVIGDLAMVSCTQRIHSAIHHAHEEPSGELRATEADTLSLFEDRFGASFQELTGHSH